MPFVGNTGECEVEYKDRSTLLEPLIKQMTVGEALRWMLTDWRCRADVARAAGDGTIRLAIETGIHVPIEVAQEVLTEILDAEAQARGVAP